MSGSDSKAGREAPRDGVPIKVFPTKREAGEAAGRLAETLLQEAIDRNGSASLVVGAANSQIEIIETLASSTTVEWKKVTLFHMDEYVGISASHTASFRRWVREHLVDRVNIGTVNYVMGDARDPLAEAKRYSELYNAAPADLVLLGFGENGHIAFNEPEVADFEDPETMKLVYLDEKSRLQQVGEGHFATLEDVPRSALTLTCSALFAGRDWIVTVPEKRKAQAVHDAFAGPITEACPASLVRRHPGAVLFLDEDSASLLPPPE